MNQKIKRNSQNRVEELCNDRAVIDYIRTLNSFNSKRSMTYFVRCFIENFLKIDKEFTWEKINDALISHVVDVLLQEQQSPATINTKLCAIKGCAKRLWIQGRIEGKIYQIISDISNVRGSRLSHGRMLSDNEVKRLFEYVDNQDSLKQIRDSAIFSVMIGTGLRRGEVAKLTTLNLFLDEKIPFLRVIGKGNKERQIPLPDFTFKRLKSWIEARGEHKGPLFIHILKNESLTNCALDGTRIYKICNEYVKKMGMKKWTPHDLRRTCASKLISMGVDLITVRDYLGHSSIATTQLYDKRSLSKLEKVAQNINY